MTDFHKHQALAVTYLTGQAGPAEVAQYRELYASSAEFRTTVHQIEAWLAPLNAGVDDVEPPAGLLDVIMSDIASVEQQGARDALPSPSPQTRPFPWRAVAIAASAVAVVATGTHFIDVRAPELARQPTPAMAEALMAVLSDESSPELIAVVYTPSDGRIVAQFSNIDVPDGKSLQLWLLRDGEDAPQSLGLLEPVQQGSRAELEVAGALRPATDTLAVSLEEAGGSNSGAPQGPVLFTGAVRGGASR